MGKSSRYGLQVQISEPKTSLPLHCILLETSPYNVLINPMSHLVVDTQSELLVRVGHVRGIAEAVDRQTAYQGVRYSLFIIAWD